MSMEHQHNHNHNNEHDDDRDGDHRDVNHDAAQNEAVEQATEKVKQVTANDTQSSAVNEDATTSEMTAATAATEDVASSFDVTEVKRALEAALLAASEPMAINELKRIFDGQVSVDTIRNLLDEVRLEWAGRSVELATVASGYRFRIKPEYQKYLDKLSNDKPLKYSRAVLETLAIIAYRQPVTRGDIEDIRGVAVSPHILKTLEDRGWIDEIGHRETVGRPALFATTKHFLDDLNLHSLEELPPLHELQATLDMTQAGAAMGLNALMGTIPLGLPGVASEDAASDTPSNTPVDDEVPPQQADADVNHTNTVVQSTVQDVVQDTSTHDSPMDILQDTPNTPHHEESSNMNTVKPESQT